MPQPGRTVAEVLGAWVSGVEYALLPRAVRDEATKALINSIGTGLGGFCLEDPQRAVQIARAEPGGAARVLIDGTRVSILSAAFTNAVMFNALGQEETHAASGTHCSEVIVPLLLAMAELIPLSGDEFVAAYVAGMEAGMHVGSVSVLPSVPWERCESNGVYGTIAAAGAAARALRLPPSLAAESLSIAANLASGLSECFRSGTSEFHWSVARASANGYLAAQLAGAGAQAAAATFGGASGFFHLFGGVDSADLDEEQLAREVARTLGLQFKMLDLIYKPWPIHFTGTPFVDAARKLQHSHDIQTEAIEAIRLTLDPATVANGGGRLGPYADRGEVVGSIAFPVAAMLSRGHVGLADTLDVLAPDIGRLVDRCSIVESGAASLNSLEVVTAERRFISHLGGDTADYGLSLEQIITIYREAIANTSGFISLSTSEHLLDELLHVADQPSMRELVNLMVHS